MKSLIMLPSVCAAAILSTALVTLPDRAHAQSRQSVSGLSNATAGPEKKLTRFKLYEVIPPSGSFSTFFNFDAYGGQFTPSALNSFGHLAGSYIFNETLQVAGSYLWRHGRAMVLPSLPSADTIFDGGSNANGLNDSGIAIGISAYGEVSPYNGKPYYHAVFWQDGNVRDLGDLGGGDSWANYINDRGLVVGFAYNSTPDPYSFYGTQYHATTWSDGKIRDLGTLGGTDSEAWTANDRNEVIGISLLNTSVVPPFNQPQEDAFVWSRGTMRDLGTLGGNFSTPTAINREGQVTVLSFDSTNQQFQSFLWCEGKKSVLSGLGGEFVEATTLNDAGIITGAATDPTNTNFIAEIWQPTGEGHSMGTIAGDTGSVGLGINNWKAIVGGSGSVTLTGNSYVHAFIWQHGIMKDLNTMVPAGSPLTLNVAYAINDRGVIAGWGTNSAGYQRAFVLVPDDRDDGPGFASAASLPAAPGSSIHMPSVASQMLQYSRMQSKSKPLNRTVQ